MSVKFDGMSDDQIASLPVLEWRDWRKYLDKKMVTASDKGQRSGQRRRANERYRVVLEVRKKKNLPF